MTRPTKRTRRQCPCGEWYTAGPYAKTCPACRARHRLQNLWKGRKKYVWTDEKDAYLREHYDGKVKGRAAEIAKVFGWPTWSIKKRAALLGLTYAADRRDWTPEEVGFLEEYSGRRTIHWLARRLKRTETSVVLKLKRMGISRRARDYFTARDLSQCFGIDVHGVTRWIDRGWLSAKKMGTDRPNDYYYITETNVLEFVRNHPMEFRLDKVDQLWFMDLVLGGGLLRGHSSRGDGFGAVKSELLGRRSA